MNTIEKAKKNSVITAYQAHTTDTGSSVVQVALITNRINHLNKHFGMFPKDYASRTGLMKLVGQRRRLLAYIKHHDEAQYRETIGRLDLRR